MSNDSCSPKASAVSPFFILFIVFMVLKLTAVIDWSWWWVTAPLWGPIAICGVCLSIIWTVIGIISLFGGKE